MEIEQKFLIKYLPDDINKYPVKDIVQGYLLCGPVLRIRKSNDNYILTYKSHMGMDVNMQRGACICNEIEAPLTKEAFEKLLGKCDGSIIKKKRYCIPLDEKVVGISDLVAELDIFDDILEGLMFAEVEFKNKEDMSQFIKPEWFGENVSDDIRYKNSFMTTISDRKMFEEIYK